MLHAVEQVLMCAYELSRSCSERGVNFLNREDAVNFVHTLGYWITREIRGLKSKANKRGLGTIHSSAHLWRETGE